MQTDTYGVQIFTRVLSGHIELTRIFVEIMKQYNMGLPFISFSRSIYPCL